MIFHCVSSLLYRVAVRSLASTIVTHSLSKDSQLLPRKRNRLLEEQYLNDRATLIGDGNWLWKTYVWFISINPTSFFRVTFWVVSSEKKSGARWPPFGESTGHGWKEPGQNKTVVFHSWIFWVIQVPKHQVSHPSRGEKRWPQEGESSSFYESFFRRARRRSPTFVSLREFFS